MALWITDGVLQWTSSAPAKHSIQTDIQMKGDIIIPEGVTHIEDNSFPRCSKISSLTLPASLTSIGDATLDGSMTYFSPHDIKIILNVSDSTTDISKIIEALGINAFRVKKDVFSAIQIHLSEIKISENHPTLRFENGFLISKEGVLYWMQPGIKNAIIPDGVTSITGFAFYSNRIKLKSITIPDSVTSISSSAFTGCHSIENMILSKNHPVFRWENNLLTSKDGILIWGISSMNQVSIPNNITSIGDGAFCDEQNLRDISIPDSVTSIGNGAFYNCWSLTSITIPDSVTSIGKRAFRYCDGLKHITLSNRITSIENYTFSHCKKLTSISIPNSVVSIGEGAFYACYDLTSITIPNSVTSIGEGAFYGCDRLKNITIPDSVTSIGKSAFRYCKSLQHITLSNRITSIENDTFSYCDSLTSIVIPNSVTSIGDEAFYYCRKLTSVTISNSTVSIGNRVFDECPNLTSISIPGDIKIKFMSKELRNSLKGIRCISNVDKVSSAIRPMVYATFARHEAEYSDELKREHIAAIHKNAAKIVKAAFDYPELLYLMCREQLISAKNIDAYLEEATLRGNVEYTALLLNYQVTQLRTKDVSDARKRRKNSI